MPNAKDFSPLDAGLFVSVVGPNGSGKSRFALSCAKAGKAYAFLAPKAELLSYAGQDMEYDVFVDEKWQPSQKSFVATAYSAMMAKLKELEGRDDLRFIVFDTMSAGPSSAIWHDVMSAYGTDDPRTLGGNSRQPYVTYRSRFEELMDRLDLLRFRKKVHIVTLWHEDVRESEGTGTPRKETEGGKTTLHWDVARLPMMLGSLRQDVNKWFDCAFYAQPVIGSNPFRCQLLGLPDATRLAKTRLDLAQALMGAELANDWPALAALLAKRYPTVPTTTSK